MYKIHILSGEEGFVFSVTNVAASDEGRGGGQSDGMVLRSWGNVDPFPTHLYSSEGKTDSIPKRQRLIPRNVY